MKDCSRNSRMSRRKSHQVHESIARTTGHTSIHVLFSYVYHSVCCRSPIVPVRPTYSAELLTVSMNGSLPRSASGTGSAPDLSSTASPPTVNEAAEWNDDHHHHHLQHQCTNGSDNNAHNARSPQVSPSDGLAVSLLKSLASHESHSCTVQ